ncbi:FliH/SctL family protein [Sinomonas halotolerans]|uniref:FliH/SctL family protein n=1 Tax=Sinomonas halotolerans TaxID=1644133 RepID=A0ABU9WYR4_9MICC
MSTEHAVSTSLAPAAGASPAGALPAYAAVQYPVLGESPASVREEAQARARGHAAGYAAGMRAAQEMLEVRLAAFEEEKAAWFVQARGTLAHAVGALDAAASAARALAAPVLAEAEDAVVRSALELAGAVVGHELSRDDAAAASVLARLGASAEVPLRVRVSADDFDAVTAALGADEAPRTLVVDPALGRGDAVAELPAGILDARIATAFERARAALGEGA